MDSIHERKPNLNCQVNLVIIVCPYMNLIARKYSHTARVCIVIFLCVNRSLKDSRFCMQEKGLTPHKAKDGT